MDYSVEICSSLQNDDKMNRPLNYSHKKRKKKTVGSNVKSKSIVKSTLW
jgi:hypothetical protein